MRLLDALLDGRDVLRGIDAADDLVLELEALPPGSAGSTRMLITTWPYWPLPPVCGRTCPRPSRRGADRLAVGHLRLADVGLDLELAHHAVDDDLEVQLAHAGDDRLAGLLVGVHAEGRVLLGQLRWSAMPSLSWSALVFGSMATSMTGSGNSSTRG
jgi:hypothetical protein